jgi:hypothetical protein
MELMNNIDFFNRFTLAVLDDLHASFPTPKDLNIANLAESVIPEDATHEDTWNMLQSAEDTVRFLAAEGFLIHGGEYLEGGTFINARLTLKGLAILGSTPDSLAGSKPLIDQIKGALANGGKTASSEVVKGLVQKALSVAISYSSAVAGSLQQ